MTCQFAPFRVSVSVKLHFLCSECNIWRQFHQKRPILSDTLRTTNSNYLAVCSLVDLLLLASERGRGNYRWRKNLLHSDIFSSIAIEVSTQHLTAMRVDRVYKHRRHKAPNIVSNYSRDEDAATIAMRPGVLGGNQSKQDGSAHLIITAITTRATVSPIILILRISSYV